MNINRITWTIFIVLSSIALGVWFHFSYPQLAFTNLSVTRQEATSIARNYLEEQQADLTGFSSATAFSMENRANRYIQRAVGFDGLMNFINKNQFDLFFWLVRFYKEGDIEGYKFAISSSTGKIISYSHNIPVKASKPVISKDAAKERIHSFLTDQFNFDFNDYTEQRDVTTKRDNRTDYYWSWLKKSVNIPWNQEADAETGKLAMGATVSGDEILSFSRESFLVPEDFDIMISKKRNTGNNLTTIIRLFYTFLYLSSIYFILMRRNHLAMHLTKRFYIKIAIFAFLLSIANDINYFQITLYNYHTMSPFKDMIARWIINTLKGTFFNVVAIILPGLACELLNYEVFKTKKLRSFLFYVRSTFLTRDVARSIGLGYCVFFMMLGLQTIMIQIGQTYWDVWIEHSMIGNLSSSYLPALAALGLGFRASFFEEIMYRAYAIPWLTKIFKNTVIAAILSSLLWGYAHSSYPVYPMWFRGLEVSVLGLFLSFIYLRYGLICVLVAHYAFDVFWHSAGHIFGTSTTSLFLSSLGVLSIPMIFAIFAWFINKPVKLAPLKWSLSKHQLFNLEVLKHYLAANPKIIENKSKEELRKEIASHGWDYAVVEHALEITEVDADENH